MSFFKMASVRSIPPVNNDSEMEEGEIVDELDDLSDISSEEEFLLRQRLLVLENYNNVLERKEAKRVSILSGKNEKGTEFISDDLSDISATELENNTPHSCKNSKALTYSKCSHRQKKVTVHNCQKKVRENKKKIHRKRRLEVKVISESSEESDDEYRNKRRKLANAVALHKVKVDTSLKARIEKMLHGKENDECLNIEITKKIVNVDDSCRLNSTEKKTDADNNTEQCIEENKIEMKTDTASNSPQRNQEYNNNLIQSTKTRESKSHDIIELFDLCSEDSKDIEVLNLDEKTEDVVDSGNKEHTNDKQDSDDELEVLRQFALKTKNLKTKSQESESSALVQNKSQSENDDSDTADLRLICLKSALLKKAIEMKFKQKLRKRLKSKSISLQDDLMIYQEEMGKAVDLENNTDIESVDMDIGSDGDDRIKESNGNSNVDLEQKMVLDNVDNHIHANKEDELEEDEDLLRARLLISLSKNLPNLVDMDIVKTFDNNENDNNTADKPQNKQDVSEEKKFIINLDDSDSEGEHEATKNLTKMHMKLSEQVDFQQKLDLFLKSTRMKVENNKLPDVVQQSPVPKPPAKYVPKAVNHLPKSEQIEYRNLVKRMAELEKLKQVRQASMNSQNSKLVPKETLKPRNVTVETTNVFHVNIEEKIALSRKNIAEESAKMLKLKEEATKLLQKYKIVATELRNISTAITLNKKEQRTVQNRLSRIRVQHQMLLKSSNFKHSTGGLPSLNQIHNKNIVSKLQKENNPGKDEYKSPNMLKTVTVSILNNLRKDNTGPNTKLSVQVDVSSNKKTVKMPKNTDSERIVSIIEDKSDTMKKKSASDTSCDKKDTSIVQDTKCVNLQIEVTSDIVTNNGKKDKDTSEYQSPLDALGSTTWQEDPNAFLCPYEVDGSCRDPDCKFLHPKIPSRQ